MLVTLTAAEQNLLLGLIAQYIAECTTNSRYLRSSYLHATAAIDALDRKASQAADLRDKLQALQATDLRDKLRGLKDL